MGGRRRAFPHISRGTSLRRHAHVVGDRLDRRRGWAARRPSGKDAARRRPGREGDDDDRFRDLDIGQVTRGFHDETRDARLPVRQ